MPPRTLQRAARRDGQPASHSSDRLAHRAEKATARVAAFFAAFRREIAAEASLDPEPTRLSKNWDSWLARSLDRGRKLAELAEAEALTTYPEDPAPLASQGLAAFLDWSARQERRRRARRAA